MSPAKKKSVLVADSLPLYSDIIAWHLSQNGYYVHTCEHFTQLLELMKSNKYDVVILDLLLHGVYGSTTIKEIIRQHPKTPIMILTSAVNSDTAKNLLDVGVSACISKTSYIANFPAIVELVIAGERYISVELSLNTQGEHITLDEKEMQIVQRLMIGLANETISKETDVHIGVVKNIIAKLLQKFKARNRTELVNAVRKSELFY